MKRFYALIIALVLCSTAIAQELKISGNVKDSGDKQPVIGATVLLKGTSTVAITDDNGNFQITVPKIGSILHVSYIGYTAKEVAIENANQLNITIEPSSNSLNEVVVVGYGTQKRSLVTGASTTLSGKEMERPGIMRADEALQGKVAGVVVTSNSGQPGEGINIRIRGAGTNGNAAPLYVVDGLQLENIEFLNPRDIESMEILKDAASSAIFGARGANGVVMITTKKGKYGERMSINADVSYGVQNLRKKMDLLDGHSYMIIQNEAAFNGGQPLQFSEEMMAKIGKGTDWQEEILYPNAPIMNAQLTIAGGSENSTYNVSGSYFNQDGIFAKNKSNFERYTFRESTEMKYFENRFKIGQSVIVSVVNKKGIDPNNIWGGPILGALNMDPVTPVRDEDGKFAQSPYVSQEVVNPLARLDVTHSKYWYMSLVGNAFAELTILKDFKLRSSLSIETFNDENWGYNPIYKLNSSVENLVSGTNKSTSRMLSKTLENTLTYNKEFGDHNLTAMIGNTARVAKGSNLGGSKQGLLIESPEYAFLDWAKNEESAKAWGSPTWYHALVSYFGRINYSYADKYMVTASFRADGSTRFGSNNRFGYFPAISAGWNMSSEKFMQDISWIDALKVRASWGQNGNEKIGDWQYLSTISSGARSYEFGDTMYPGSSPSRASNPDIKWETSEQFNVGFDLRFEKRFNATVDYYIKSTKDLLIYVPIPTHVGVGAAASNAGSVRNSGIELTLGYNDRAGDWYWGADFNIAWNTNKVTQIGNNDGYIRGANAGTSMLSVTMMRETFPISYFWGYETDGIFQNTGEIAKHQKDGAMIQPDAVAGDFRYRDLNNDGQIDDDDRTMIGNPNPDFTGGLTLTAGWKNVDFSVFFSGMHGNDIFNATRRWDLPMSNYQINVMDRWHGEGTSNAYPRLTTNDTNKNFSRPSSFFIEDGSFLRMKNITLGYTFDNLEKYSINKIRVYVSANNLFTLTKYSGLDPEIGSGSVLGNGIDYGMYPQPRTITAGINITF